MTEEPRYGAGLWHFAQYVDRYATDGYGPPVTTLEAIDLAGQVRDLAVVDITYPFNPPGLPVSQVAAALKRNGLGAIGITPGGLHPGVLPGSVYQSRSRRPRAGYRACPPSRRYRTRARVRLRQAMARARWA